VFFVQDKAMPGWSVVLKKETRSRRMNSTEDEHGLGQEGCSDDLQVIADMELQISGSRDNIGGDEAGFVQNSGRRRTWNEAC
jgi:hypothetical protein